MAGQLGKKASIGQLRHRLKLQRPASAADEFHGGGTKPSGSWEDVATVPIRGKVWPTGGSELFQNGTVQARATHRVLIRYRGDIGPKCRLVWLDTNLILNIVACPPSVGTENVIEVWCVQEVKT